MTAPGWHNRRSMEEAVLAEILAHLREERANSTEAFARLRSSITNDVLDSGAYLLDPSGLATGSYQTPYGSLFVANLGSGDMTVTSSPPGSAAPPKGRGVHIVPAHSAALLNLAGTAWTIYGTAGDLADVQAFTRPWPPSLVGTLVRGGAAVGAAGDLLGVTLASQPGSTPSEQTSGANAANTVTFAAVTGQRHRLTLCIASWSGAVGTGVLSVDFGGASVLAVDLPTAVNTPFALPLPAGGIQAPPGTVMNVSVSAGGAGAISKLSVAKLTG